jgi:hypothetical protein
MKRHLMIFLQFTVIIFGIGVLLAMFLEPQFEGRNVNATFYEIYFKDSFLAYAYVASLPFFIALYQAFRFFNQIKQNKLNSPATQKALKIIKYCSIITIPFIWVGVIILMSSESDDRPPIFMIAMLMTLVAIVVVVATARFENLIKKQ